MSAAGVHFPPVFAYAKSGPFRQIDFNTRFIRIKSQKSMPEEANQQKAGGLASK